MNKLAAAIARLGSHEALTLGALRADLPKQVGVVTKRRLDKLNGAARPDIIARTSDYIVFQPGQPALALLDFDTKGMPPQVAAKLDSLDGFWPAIVSICPDLTNVARVTRRSTSAGLFRSDTHEGLPGSNGKHVFITVKDGSDIERFLRTLHLRCWLSGLGWLMLGTGGQLLERSIVDRVVCAPERLVFEGPPILDPLLAQNAASRQPSAIAGTMLDTLQPVRRSALSRRQGTAQRGPRKRPVSPPRFRRRKLSSLRGNLGGWPSARVWRPAGRCGSSSANARASCSPSLFCRSMTPS